MPLTRTQYLIWTPRVLSILLICFISMFALDVFAEGRPWTAILAALLVHLIPAYVLILILILAWRRPWIGAAGYTVLAIAYAVWAHQHADWVLIIAGPLLAVAILFWLSWVLARPAAPGA
jgi:hypothetical protein